MCPVLGHELDKKKGNVFYDVKISYLRNDLNGTLFEGQSQLTFLLFIRTVDGSHIILKSPLDPHVAHVAVTLESFALQAAGRPDVEGRVYIRPCRTKNQDVLLLVPQPLYFPVCICGLLISPISLFAS